MNEMERIEQLVSQYLKLEQSAKAIVEEIENDDETQAHIKHNKELIEKHKSEIEELTAVSNEKAKQIGEQQRVLLDELKKMYANEKTIETNHGTVQYRITKKTIIHDAGKVAGILLKNDKPEAIKSFDMKIIRSFIEVGLLVDIAGFEENVNVKVVPTKEFEGE